MKKASPFIGAMLIIIILCPTYLAVPSVSQLQPQILTVQIKTETKTEQVFNETILTTELTRIEKWTNGTLLQMTFYHILNPSNSSAQQASNITYIAKLAILQIEHQPREYYGTNSTPLREVIVTYRKWIINTTTPETESASIKTSTIRPLASVIYPYTDRIDTLKFVLKGSYGNVFATYDHDDNYNPDGYYPLEANTPYILRGSQKPYHIHLIKDLLDSWVIGNLTAAMVVAATFLLQYTVGELIEMGLEALSAEIAAILSMPIVVVILLINDIVEAIQAFLEALGFIKEADWVQSVVRERFLNDGWAWRGPISKSELVGWVWCPFWFKPITGWGIYQYREFEQTWGSEGIFNPNPHQYSICCYDRTEWLSASSSATWR